MSGRNGILSRLIVAAFVLCIGTAVQAEKRVALVIGNSAYRSAPKLPNPAGDARLISDTLSSLGFLVVGGGAQVDLTKTGFDDVLQAFGRELAGADVALFYYAGHGVETHGLNYLVPVDADPVNEGDVFMQGIGMAGVLDQMEKSGARINLVLLDACRNNPFRDRGVRSATGGLAQMQAPAGTLISFATQPRSVALDGRHHAASGLWPVQDLQRGRACGGEGNPWPAIAVGRRLADRRQVLFFRRAGGGQGNRACTGCRTSAQAAARRPALTRATPLSLAAETSMECHT
jgi:hypothetical protein